MQWKGFTTTLIFNQPNLRILDPEKTMNRSLKLDAFNPVTYALF